MRGVPLPYATSAERAPAHEIVASDFVLHAHLLQRGLASVGEFWFGPAAVVMHLAIAADARAGKDDVERNADVRLEVRNIHLARGQLDVSHHGYRLQLAGSCEAAFAQLASQLENARLVELVAEVVDAATERVDLDLHRLVASG